MINKSLGLIADSTIQVNKLKAMAERAGFEVVTALTSADLSDSPLPLADCWVLRIEHHAEKDLQFVELLEDQSLTVIYDDSESYVGLEESIAAQKFARKISAATPSVGRADTQHKGRARIVWVLAASTGGPDAVSEFIKHLPENLDSIAFVYVQHIDERMTESLKYVLQRHTNWTVHNCNQTQRILEKSFYVVSPEYQVDLDDMGNLVPTSERWSGCYSPSIDQVMAKVAKVYKDKSGAVIFSGMGNDGARACRLISHAGGKVWAQLPETCAVDSHACRGDCDKCGFICS